MKHHFQINGNGDKADTLKAEFIRVMNAANALRKALDAVTLNGRNYQTLEDAQRRLGMDQMALSSMKVMADDIGLWAEVGAIRVLDQV
jgi:hypothetical protein